MATKRDLDALEAATRADIEVLRETSRLEHEGMQEGLRLTIEASEQRILATVQADLLKHTRAMFLGLVGAVVSVGGLAFGAVRLT